MTTSNPTLAEMIAIATKKTWEKGIGAKYNSNDTVNQLAQHAALINMGMSMVTKPTSGRSGKR